MSSTGLWSTTWHMSTSFWYSRAAAAADTALYQSVMESKTLWTRPRPSRTSMLKIRIQSPSQVQRQSGPSWRTWTLPTAQSSRPLRRTMGESGRMCTSGSMAES